MRKLILLPACLLLGFSLTALLGVVAPAQSGDTALQTKVATMPVPRATSPKLARVAPLGVATMCRAMLVVAELADSPSAVKVTRSHSPDLVHVVYVADKMVGHIASAQCRRSGPRSIQWKLGNGSWQKPLPDSVVSILGDRDTPIRITRLTSDAWQLFEFEPEMFQ